MMRSSMLLIKHAKLKQSTTAMVKGVEELSTATRQ
jgi:hypothetical protein